MQHSWLLKCSLRSERPDLIILKDCHHPVILDIHVGYTDTWYHSPSSSNSTYHGRFRNPEKYALEIASVKCLRPFPIPFNLLDRFPPSCRSWFIHASMLSDWWPKIGFYNELHVFSVNGNIDKYMKSSMRVGGRKNYQVPRLETKDSRYTYSCRGLWRYCL